jgi:tRNA nucleotidyltransferase/poly(A) polymerase
VPKVAATARLSPEALEPLRLAARLHSGKPVYLVGGALRDLFLGRPLADLDLACRGAQQLARALAARLKGSFVVLDDATQVYRVALPESFGALRQLDVAELQGEGIEDDLRRRDFPLNALALPLREDLPAAISAKAVLDPRGGFSDLAAGRLRCEDEKLLKEDPLRLLRAFRIAAQLGFSLEPATLERLAKVHHRVRQPAGERLRAELLLLLNVPGASASLRQMDEARVLTGLFEEMEPARQCAEEYYGAGGVMKHSLDTCERADYLMTHIGRVWPEQAEAIENRMSEGGPNFRALVMLAAFLHDVAKPETARTVEGRLRFFAHDSIGAQRVEAILKKLRCSGEETALIKAVVLHHLRPGHLATSGVITEKALYRFFRDLGPHALPLLFACWADHASYLSQDRVSRALKTAALEPGQGKAALARLKPQEARKTIYHLQVISLLVRRLFDEQRKPVPDRLLNGTEVMKLLGLKPGPQVGEWLERLREAQAEGKLSTRDEALAWLKAEKAKA